MLKILKLCSLVIPLYLSNCASVESYSTIAISPELSNAHVIIEAPKSLKSYDPTLANTWERTQNYCQQKTVAMAKEIDVRENNLQKQRRIILTVGGIAGALNTIYSGVEENPEKLVLLSLGAISGSALFTVIPTLSSDDRIKKLKVKYDQINMAQTESIDALNKLESKLVDRGMIRLRIKPPNGREIPDQSELTKLFTELDKVTSEATSLKHELRVSLKKWKILCD